jgi:hypothetical protein
MHLSSSTGGNRHLSPLFWSRELGKEEVGLVAVPRG